MRLLLLAFRLDRVLWAPFEKHPAPAGVESLGRGCLEVLANNHELAAVVEVDDVPGEHAGVDDVPDPPRDGVGVVPPGPPVLCHPDLLRPDGERVAEAAQHIRRTNEP